MTSNAGAENHVDKYDTSEQDGFVDDSFVSAAEEWQDRHVVAAAPTDTEALATVAEADLSSDDSEEDELGNDLPNHGRIRRASGREITETPEDGTLPPEPGDAPVSGYQQSDPSPEPGSSNQDSSRSSPSNSRPGSRLSVRHSSAGQPFDKRFQAQRKTSNLQALRSASPAFLSSHSRQVSMTSQMSISSSNQAEDDDNMPWEVIKWTRLKKMTAQLFTEAGKRAFGSRTFLVVGASIVIGTSKGLVLVFDFHQVLQHILGQGTPAAECGAITSLALSADHTTIAAGHANGFIFTWDLSNPTKPFLIINPLPQNRLSNRSFDAHVQDRAILHVGFLGTRHTALVSADDSGMAFSHLATRGLGAVGRTVKSTRILGRYPQPSSAPAASVRPSSVLACSPLPLGNVEQPTDDMGLTALLTPYLLVIVSTTPVAQTQFKAPRTKNTEAHSAMTGCLAWFPAVKLKSAQQNAKHSTSKTKLAYCWSSVLTILEVEVEPLEPDQEDRRPNLHFNVQRQWNSEEAITAVQWLSRSVLAVFTITQRLVILEEKTLHVSDSLDLIPRHIFHHDSFSQQLEPLVSTVGQGDDSMHGVVPDAYHMSFRVYKGRVFLLGTSDVSMGTLSNWADRLVALMAAGRLIEAIELATSYYSGSGEKATVGLPEDDDRRRSIVSERLLETITASLQYTTKMDATDELGKDLRSAAQELVEPLFAACITMNEIEFLFDDVYEWYRDTSCQDFFFHSLEPRIISEEITVVPTEVLKDLALWYSSLDMGARLEEMICSLRPETFDIDQVTHLCKQYRLYNALIYVWNQAVHDYITPLIELLKLADSQREVDGEDTELWNSAMKTFTYLAYTLTGRIYPTGEDLTASDADRARASIYGFLFSGRTIEWPASSGQRVELDTSSASRPNYPYLRSMLKFNTPEFMSMMNEAFEDNFLNGGSDHLTNGLLPEEAEDNPAGWSMNRQRIIAILLEVLNSSSFDHEDRIFLDIFIARNLPKFPQFILLDGKTLQRILVELCEPPQEDLSGECQLSVEYLLSIYRPSDMQGLLPLFERAGFFRVLKSTYRASRQYAKWLQTHFDDHDEPNAVFDAIADCLRPATGLSNRQISEVKALALDHASDLAVIDARRTAKCFRDYAPDLLGDVFGRLEQHALRQYRFLKPLVEPSQDDKSSSQEQAAVSEFVHSHYERYVQLLCRFDAGHVADFVRLLQPKDLQLDQVIPVMESTGVIDAAVVLLAKDGLVREALGRLVEHLGTLQTALLGLLDSKKDEALNSLDGSEVDNLVDETEKYAKLGIWLCQSRSSEGARASGEKKGARGIGRDELSKHHLTDKETLWADLIDAVVGLSRALTNLESKSLSPNSVDQSSAPAADSEDVLSRATAPLRVMVQETFTALLAATAAGSRQGDQEEEEQGTARPPRLLPILREFLDRLSRSVSPSSPASFAALRPILSSILSAYAFEESVLKLSQQLMDKDVFVSVDEIARQRQRGWKPSGRACSRCGLRCWGVGTGAGVWEDWAHRREQSGRQRLAKLQPQDSAGKGKGRLVEEQQGRVGQEVEDAKGGLVLFACRHVFHRTCLEEGLKEAGLDKAAASMQYACLVCD